MLLDYVFVCECVGREARLHDEGWLVEAHLAGSANGEQIRSEEILEVQIAL